MKRTEEIIARLRHAGQCNDSDLCEAADRLEELLSAMKAIVKHQEVVSGPLAKFTMSWVIATQAINGKQEALQ